MGRISWTAFLLVLFLVLEKQIEISTRIGRNAEKVDFLSIGKDKDEFRIRLSRLGDGGVGNDTAIFD